MKPTSKFSATMIGIHNSEDPKEALSRKIYCEEAQEIAKIMSGVHYSRKLSHQQVFYPETVKKLGAMQREHSAPLTGAATGSGLYASSTTQLGESGASVRPQSKVEKVYAAREMKLKDFQEQFTQHIRNEQFVNDRKRNYNREVGRKAVVNQIISGTAPMPKYSLFPQGATHEQILALTNTLKAPDANTIPPEVPKLRKWKGDHVGWGQPQN